MNLKKQNQFVRVLDYLTKHRLNQLIDTTFYIMTEKKILFNLAFSINLNAKLITEIKKLHKNADVYEILCQANLVAEENEDFAINVGKNI